MKMKKKIGIIILLIIIVLIIFIGILMFTGIGEEIRAFIYYKIHTPQEIVSLDKTDNIKVTYTYQFKEESFDIDITDVELIKMINDSIINKKLDNYSSQIGLAVIGQYNVNLGNNTSFAFDSYDNDGFVMMFNEDKKFLTKINPEILKRVIEIVDAKLTENVEIYKTNKISITKTEKGKNDTILKKDNTNIEEKTAIEYIINQCKNVYTKEIDYEPSIVHPDYEIDFNNNVKLLVYSQNERGWMLKDGFLLEAYGLNSFDTILENAFNNIEQKKQMFTTDKIKIISPNKEIEITNKDTVEKITTTLIYSKIYRPDWIEDYNIKEEYDTGIKVKINDNEFLIPGIKTIGNRYVITKDNKISLCFPLQNIEKDINELLGIKQEENKGPVSIGI